MSEIGPNEIVIDDSNYEEHTQEVVIDGERKAFGLVPRNFRRQPVGSIRGIARFDMPIIPREEWSSRIKDLEQSRTRLSDLRDIGGDGSPIPSTDQGNKGYCWAHSPVSALMLARARDGQPYVRLSAYAVACMIKNFRDQGGWNPQAVEFLIKTGCPSVERWPEKSMNRNNNNQQTWAEAKQYRVTEGFMDINTSVYDRNLSLDQLMTCLLSRIPCPVDLNWWGHSVCAVDAVEFDDSLPLSDPNRWGTRIWNSWSDSWGERGMGVLRGRKAIPDGATALKVATLAA